MVALLPPALARLPNASQRLLEAHYRGGMGCRAIGVCEGVHEKSIRQRLYRARQRLHEQLLVEANRRNK